MAEIAVATQLYGWTQSLNFPNRPPLLERLDEAFDAIGRAGIENVEHSVEMAANDTFLNALARHGLGFPSAYVGGTFHTEPEAEASIESIVAKARVASDVGVQVLNCNPSPKPDGEEKTDAELAVQARMLDRCGAELIALGIRLALHNHTPAMRSGGREVHSNLRNTTPTNVWLNADFEWIRHGGGDPVAFIEEYADRTASLHVRDAIGTQWVQAVGDGDMPYPKIAEVLKAKHFVGPLAIELATDPTTEITRSFEENHRISREFVQHVFGA